MPEPLFPCPPQCAGCGTVLAPHLPVVAWVYGWGLCAACRQPETQAQLMAEAQLPPTVLFDDLAVRQVRQLLATMTNCAVARAYHVSVGIVRARRAALGVAPKSVGRPRKEPRAS